MEANQSNNHTNHPNEVQPAFPGAMAATSSQENAQKVKKSECSVLDSFAPKYESTQQNSHEDTNEYLESSGRKNLSSLSVQKVETKFISLEAPEAKKSRLELSQDPCAAAAASLNSSMAALGASAHPEVQEMTRTVNRLFQWLDTKKSQILGSEELYRLDQLIQQLFGTLNDAGQVSTIFNSVESVRELLLSILDLDCDGVVSRADFKAYFANRMVLGSVPPGIVESAATPRPLDSFDFEEFERVLNGREIPKNADFSTFRSSEASEQVGKDMKGSEVSAAGTVDICVDVIRESVLLSATSEEMMKLSSLRQKSVFGEDNAAEQAPRGNLQSIMDENGQEFEWRTLKFENSEKLLEIGQNLQISQKLSGESCGELEEIAEMDGEESIQSEVIKMSRLASVTLKTVITGNSKNARTSRSRKSSKRRNTTDGKSVRFVDEVQLPSAVSPSRPSKNCQNTDFEVQDLQSLPEEAMGVCGDEWSRRRMAMSPDGSHSVRNDQNGVKSFISEIRKNHQKNRIEESNEAQGDLSQTGTSEKTNFSAQEGTFPKNFVSLMKKGEPSPERVIDRSNEEEYQQGVQVEPAKCSPIPKNVTQPQNLANHSFLTQRSLTINKPTRTGLDSLEASQISMIPRLRLGKLPGGQKNQNLAESKDSLQGAWGGLGHLPGDTELESETRKAPTTQDSVDEPQNSQEIEKFENCLKPYKTDSRENSECSSPVGYLGEMQHNEEDDFKTLKSTPRVPDNSDPRNSQNTQKSPKLGKKGYNDTPEDSNGQQGGLEGLKSQGYQMSPIEKELMQICSDVDNSVTSIPPSSKFRAGSNTVHSSGGQTPQKDQKSPKSRKDKIEPLRRIQSRSRKFQTERSRKKRKKPQQVPPDACSRRSGEKIGLKFRNGKNGDFEGSCSSQSTERRRRASEKLDEVGEESVNYQDCSPRRRRRRKGHKSRRKLSRVSGGSESSPMVLSRRNEVSHDSKTSRGSRRKSRSFNNLRSSKKRQNRKKHKSRSKNRSKRKSRSKRSHRRSSTQPEMAKIDPNISQFDVSGLAMPQPEKEPIFGFEENGHHQEDYGGRRGPRSHLETVETSSNRNLVQNDGLVRTEQKGLNLNRRGSRTRESSLNRTRGRMMEPAFNHGGLCHANNAEMGSGPETGFRGLQADSIVCEEIDSGSGHVQNINHAQIVLDSPKKLDNSQKTSSMSRQLMSQFETFKRKSRLDSKVLIEVSPPLSNRDAQIHGLTLLSAKKVNFSPSASILAEKVISGHSGSSPGSEDYDAVHTSPNKLQIGSKPSQNGQKGEKSEIKKQAQKQLKVDVENSSCFLMESMVNDSAATQLRKRYIEWKNSEKILGTKSKNFEKMKQDIQNELSKNSRYNSRSTVTLVNTQRARSPVSKDSLAKQKVDQKSNIGAFMGGLLTELEQKGGDYDQIRAENDQKLDISQKSQLPGKSASKPKNGRFGKNGGVSKHQKATEVPRLKAEKPMNQLNHPKSSVLAYAENQQKVPKTRVNTPQSELSYHKQGYNPQIQAKHPLRHPKNPKKVAKTQISVKKHQPIQSHQNHQNQPNRQVAYPVVPKVVNLSDSSLIIQQIYNNKNKLESDKQGPKQTTPSHKYQELNRRERERALQSTKNAQKSKSAKKVNPQNSVQKTPNNANPRQNQRKQLTGHLRSPQPRSRAPQTSKIAKSPTVSRRRIKVTGQATPVQKTTPLGRLPITYSAKGKSLKKIDCATYVVSPKIKQSSINSVAPNAISGLNGGNAGTGAPRSPICGQGKASKVVFGGGGRQAPLRPFDNNANYYKKSLSPYGKNGAKAKPRTHQNAQKSEIFQKSKISKNQKNEPKTKPAYYTIGSDGSKRACFVKPIKVDSQQTTKNHQNPKNGKNQQNQPNSENQGPSSSNYPSRSSKISIRYQNASRGSNLVKKINVGQCIDSASQSNTKSNFSSFNTNGRLMNQLVATKALEGEIRSGDLRRKLNQEPRRAETGLPALDPVLLNGLTGTLPAGDLGVLPNKEGLRITQTLAGSPSNRSKTPGGFKMGGEGGSIFGTNLTKNTVKKGLEGHQGACFGYGSPAKRSRTNVRRRKPRKSPESGFFFRQPETGFEGRRDDLGAFDGRPGGLNGRPQQRRVVDYGQRAVSPKNFDSAVYDITTKTYKKNGVGWPGCVPGGHGGSLEAPLGSVFSQKGSENGYPKSGENKVSGHPGHRENGRYDLNGQNLQASPAKTLKIHQKMSNNAFSKNAPNQAARAHSKSPNFARPTQPSSEKPNNVAMHLKNGGKQQNLLSDEQLGKLVKVETIEGKGLQGRKRVDGFNIILDPKLVEIAAKSLKKFSPSRYNRPQKCPKRDSGKPRHLTQTLKPGKRGINCISSPQRGPKYPQRANPRKSPTPDSRDSRGLQSSPHIQQLAPKPPKAISHCSGSQKDESRKSPNFKIFNGKSAKKLGDRLREGSRTKLNVLVYESNQVYGQEEPKTLQSISRSKSRKKATLSGILGNRIGKNKPKEQKSALLLAMDSWKEEGEVVGNLFKDKYSSPPHLSQQGLKTSITRNGKSGSRRGGFGPGAGVRMARRVNNFD